MLKDIPNLKIMSEIKKVLVILAENLLTTNFILNLNKNMFFIKFRIRAMKWIILFTDLIPL